MNQPTTTLTPSFGLFRVLVLRGWRRRYRSNSPLRTGRGSPRQTVRNGGRDTMQPSAPFRSRIDSFYRHSSNVY